jgi:hypothetical protein
MPANCPRFEVFLEEKGIEIMGRVGTREIMNGGGGLACAVGVLRRAPGSEVV